MTFLEDDLKLVDKIPLGKKPTTKQLEYYGENYPPSVARASKTNRFIFQKLNGTFVIIPEPRLLGMGYDKAKLKTLKGTTGL